MPPTSAMRPMMASMSAASRQFASRTFATAPKQSFVSRAQPARAQICSRQLRSSFRRSYADSVSPETKVKAKRSAFTTLKWIWRATYLSAFAGVGWVCYGIFESRNPADQAPPDPSKKTLVVLGACHIPSPLSLSRPRLVK